MQFTTIAMALSLSSTVLSAAVNGLTVTSGVAIHAPGAPVASSLNISQEGTEVEKRDLEKRGNGNLYVCTDRNFGGVCQNLAFTTQVCYNLASPFQDSISSAGPDSFTCRAYQDSGCTGPYIQFANPGISDFFNTGLNDKISSYYCF